ncbi:MAG TPA: hypothetical protein VGN08_07870 [Solirubrobacteraceae bacterium]
MTIRTALAICLLPAVAAGCGSSGGSSPASSASSSTSSSSTTAGSGTSGASALTAEAQSVATGDIPDNQVFLTFHDPASRYSIKFPEGWTQKGSGGDVSFSERNNLVHIVVAPAPAPTPGSVSAELSRLRSATPSITFTAPASVSVAAGTAVKSTYTTHSPPNPVTGKSVVLNVDRYELASGGRRAIVDLATPHGVDNVDAYRMMINSFRWQ